MRDNPGIPEYCLLIWTNYKHDRLLSHIDPDDLPFFGPFLTDLFAGPEETFLGGLSRTVDLVPRHTAKVGNALDLVLELLDLFKVVGHSHFAPDFGIVLLSSHFRLVLWGALTRLD